MSKSERYYVIKRKDPSHKGPDKFFDPRRGNWDRLNKDSLKDNRTDANRGAEDASRHGPDTTRPYPVKVVPVRIVEEDDE